MSWAEVTGHKIGGEVGLLTLVTEWFRVVKMGSPKEVTVPHTDR